MISNELQPKITQISPNLATQTIYEFNDEFPDNENYSHNDSDNNLNSDNFSATKNGNPTNNNSLYRVIVFNPNGNYKTHADCVVGSPYTPKIVLDSGVPYTIIAYSYNSGDYLPPMSCYQIDCNFDYDFSVGHSYAYQRIDDYILQKESHNILNIKLKHRIPHVKIILKTDKLSDEKDPDGANVNNSIIANSHFTKAKIQLDNGNIIKLENPVGLKINMTKIAKNFYESPWTSLLINNDKKAKYITNISATVNEVNETKTINTPIDIKANFLNKITINVIPNKDNSNENSNNGSGNGNGENGSGSENGNSGGNGENGNEDNGKDDSEGGDNGGDNSSGDGSENGNSGGGNGNSSSPGGPSKPKNPKPDPDNKDNPDNNTNVSIKIDGDKIYVINEKNNGEKDKKADEGKDCGEWIWRAYYDGNREFAYRDPFNDGLFKDPYKCLSYTNSEMSYKKRPDLSGLAPNFDNDNTYTKYYHTHHGMTSSGGLVTRYLEVNNELLANNTCEGTYVTKDADCFKCYLYGAISTSIETKCVNFDNEQGHSFSGSYDKACKALYGKYAWYHKYNDGHLGGVCSFKENGYGQEYYACLYGEETYCTEEEDAPCSPPVGKCTKLNIEGKGEFFGSNQKACEYLYGNSAKLTSNGKCSFVRDGKEVFACLTGKDVKCEEEIKCRNYTLGCVDGVKYNEKCKSLYGDSASYTEKGKCSFNIDGEKRFACLTGTDTECPKKCQPDKDAGVPPSGIELPDGVPTGKWKCRTSGLMTDERHELDSVEYLCSDARWPCSFSVIENHLGNQLSVSQTSGRVRTKCSLNFKKCEE